MNNPTVACICLTRDRPEMLKRAVTSFRAQTYERKLMIIVDTGEQPCGIEEEDNLWIPPFELKGGRSATIGYLRNMANKYAAHHYTTSPAISEIFAHFDDDDWSHPNRLTEQVALLEASGAECVGYNSMLFWDTRGCGSSICNHGICDKSWLYRAINPKHILGTSLMYHRSVWERQPFDDVSHGEDTGFVKKLNVLGVSSLQDPQDLQPLKPYIPQGYEPRMVASVHGGNSSGYEPEKDRASTRRVVEWDSYCRKVMQL